MTFIFKFKCKILLLIPLHFILIGLSYPSKFSRSFKMFCVDLYFNYFLCFSFSIVPSVSLSDLVQNIQQGRAGTVISPTTWKESFCDCSFIDEALEMLTLHQALRWIWGYRGKWNIPIGGDPISIGETHMGKWVMLRLWGVMRII